MHDEPEVKPGRGELRRGRSPEGRFLLDVAAPAVLTLAGLVGASVLLLVAQVSIRAPLLPGPGAMAMLVIGLLPSALALSLPVAGFLGALSASRSWADGGEWLGLQASGWGARRLALPLLGLGVALGAVEAVATHLVEPAGRSMARGALERSAGELRLRPGQPAQVGGFLVRAEGEREGALVDLFVAKGELVAAAERGRFTPGGGLVLEEGTARRLDAAGGELVLSFERAELALAAPSRRVELVERGDRDLARLIDRMEAAGREAAPERLALYKRTVLPLALPLLCLLGLPLGARRMRPGPAGVAVVLGWWTVMRLCDQGVRHLGPALAAGIPLICLGAAAILAWSGWRAR